MTEHLEVLVIDDNDVDRELVRRLLRDEFRVREANTAKGGLQELSDRPPACVLLDYRLPDRNGLELIPSFAHLGVPVVMMTGQGAEETAVAALKAGAVDYLSKSRIDKNVLSKALRYAIDTARLQATVARQAEQLRAKEAQLFRFLDAVPIGIYVLNQEGRPYYANKHATELLGQGVQPGVETADLSHSYSTYVAETDESYPVERMPIVRALRGETSTVRDVEVRRPDRSVLLAATATPIRMADGEVEFAIAVFQDITQEKKLETEYRQAQKMEAVGRLAGGVAHDFNNLLTAILSFGHFVLETLRPADPAHADMQELLKAAGRAEGLTRQLLAFSRKQPIKPQTLSLSELVRGVERMLARVLGEHVELRTRLTDDLWSARIDPGAFEQVLVNLAVNARDAMPHGGRLSVETTNVRLDEHTGSKLPPAMPPGEFVLMSVTDNGVGMNAETRARVFEPFFTTKAVDKGSGLGLSTCYGIVNQAGGFIWLSSELGKGTRFEVYLPRVTRPAKQLSDKPVRTALGGKETILVVEDNEQVRAIACRALERQGYQVLSAGLGGEALLICEQFKGAVDLLLTDVVMPQMSGRELVNRLLPLRPDMKVLFMSGYTDDAILHHGVLEKGVMLLHKPFLPEVLVSKVREVLDAEETDLP